MNILMPVECLHLKKHGLLEGCIHARCPYLPTAYLVGLTTQYYGHLSLSYVPKIACRLSMSMFEKKVQHHGEESRTVLANPLCFQTLS